MSGSDIFTLGLSPPWRVVYVLLPVVPLAGSAAFRAREQRTRLGGDRQVQLMRLAVGLQAGGT
jgi:hypothetical protein